MISFLAQIDYDSIDPDYSTYPWTYEVCNDLDCPCLGAHTDDLYRVLRITDAMKMLPWKELFAGAYHKIARAGFGGEPKISGESKYVIVKYDNEFSADMARFALDSTTGEFELSVCSYDGWHEPIEITWEEFCESNANLLARAKKWRKIAMRAKKLPRAFARVMELEQANAKLRRDLATARGRPKKQRRR